MNCERSDDGDVGRASGGRDVQRVVLGIDRVQRAGEHAVFVTFCAQRRMDRLPGLRMDGVTRRDDGAMRELAVHAANVRDGGLVLAAEEPRG